MRVKIVAGRAVKLLTNWDEHRGLGVKGRR